MDGIVRIQNRVLAYTGHARAFYFELLMAIYLCPSCGGRMRIASPGRWTCECGATLDPTITFQRSHCCDGRLVFRRTHYACTHCGRAVRSAFLFDERMIDARYFREKMSECRERKRRRREDLRLLLAASRSDALVLTEGPDAHRLHDLIVALDEFVCPVQTRERQALPEDAAYRMEDYRRVILSCVAGAKIRFDAFPAVAENDRIDRIRRFITLVFMEQFREVRLDQHGEEILVMPYEADIEG